MAFGATPRRARSMQPTMPRLPVSIALWGLAAFVVGAAPRAEGATVAGAAPTPFAGLVFVDVGQGSCMLAAGRDGTVVAIDAGPSGASESVLHALEAVGGGRVDLWGITHFDADHVGGLARIVDGVDGQPGTADDVELVGLWDRGGGSWPSSGAVAAYLDRFVDLRVGAADGARFETPSVVFEVIVPPVAQDLRSENERGVAFCLDLDGRRIFAPGDLPAPLVAQALARCPAPDLVWVSHHGAADGTSAEVVAASGSAVAVITSGHGNPHCHPAPSTLAAWRGHPTWITGVADRGRHGACGDLVAHLGPQHRVTGEALVFTEVGAASSIAVFGERNAVTLGAW